MPELNMVWIDGVAYAPNHRKVHEYYAKFKTNYDAQPVGELRHTERKPDTLPALDRSKKAHRRSKRGVVICVKIISVRRRPTDLDNCIAGAKGLRDSIAKSIGLDDNDPQLRWEYDTIITTGATGTQVLISKL